MPAAAMAVPSQGARSVHRLVRCRRGLGQQIIAARGQGTLMRHVIYASPVTPRPLRMREAAAAARLITTPGFAHGAATRLARTAGRAVHLTAIATAADHHLGAAAPAQKEPGRPLRIACHAPDTAWTYFPCAAIIPPHSCPRTVQGTAPMQTVRLGSVPCLSPDRIGLIAPAAEGQPQAGAGKSRFFAFLRWRPACGYVDDPLRGPAALPPGSPEGVEPGEMLAFAHIPTGPTANKSV
jgi:hypothetical protein